MLIATRCCDYNDYKSNQNSEDHGLKHYHSSCNNENN